jgi:hypothetical protein
MDSPLRLILNFFFVDLGACLVDHHASVLAVVGKVDGDLTGDQVGALPGVMLVLAIETNGVFEPDAIGDIEMKSGHLRSSWKS